METGFLKQYFIVGEKLLCFIPRTGSTSLLKLIEDKHYPFMRNVKVAPQFRIPSRPDDGKSELVSMIREPLSRFLSGCAQKGYTVEQGIAELQKPRVDIHIRSQYTFLSEKRETKLFRFPDELTACAEYLNLPTPIPHLNVSVTKPELTPEQEAWLNQYYHIDLKLWEDGKITYPLLMLQIK
jgi:hypothetical protein